MSALGTSGEERPVREPGGVRSDEVDTIEDVRLPVPLKFRRGSLRADEQRSVQSALQLLRRIERYKQLRGAKILDFGCGVKIAQALVQEGSPQALYVGLDVYPELIEHMQAALGDDPKYRFERVPFHNAMYNKSGEPMTPASSLPTDTTDFDVVTMFSVITHMVPDDARATLAILRRYIAGDGVLLFWAFANEDQSEDFVDENPEHPLLRAKYRQPFLEEIIREAGWAIESAKPRQKHARCVDYVCRPARD